MGIAFEQRSRRLSKTTRAQLVSFSVKHILLLLDIPSLPICFFRRGSFVPRTSSV
jgi:hypothetical protein